MNHLYLGKQHPQSFLVGLTTISKKAAGITYFITLVALHCSHLPAILFFCHQCFTVKNCRKKTRQGLCSPAGYMLMMS